MDLLHNPCLIPSCSSPLALGMYQHYKGDYYQVLGVAHHTETLEDLVVYKALYGQQQWWVRPVSMFCETIIWNGQEVPRFRYINPTSLS